MLQSSSFLSAFMSFTIFTLVIARVITPQESVSPVQPHQETVNGELVTFKDNEPSEMTTKQRACFQVKPAGEQNAGILERAEAANVTLKPWVFNDTTPFEGIEVEEEPFRKDDFKLC